MIKTVPAAAVAVLLIPVLLSSAQLGAQTVAPAAAAAPADGITMDMMPITNEQIKQCRDQASQQLADEQKTLSNREKTQDNSKMKQGAVAGATGIIATKLSKPGWWGGNNNGANTAAATGSTERTNRNSQDINNTTGIGQDVGKDAYAQCVSGIKGPEYVHFRQTGRLEAFTGSAPGLAANAVAAAPPPAPKSPIEDEGDGKHFILTAPGQSDAREVVAAPGLKNAYIEEATGDKYIVKADGSVTRIPKHPAASK
jgi:hypothetical protein